MPPKRKAAPGPASASAAAAASTTPKPPSYPSLVFAAVVLPLILGTYLSLQHQQLVPLYNSLPLGLHPYLLLAGYLGAVAAARAGFERASPATWAYLAALGVDFAELAGRRVASLCGTFLGPEWGAFAAQLVLSALPILGVAGCFFALTDTYVHGHGLVSKATPVHGPVARGAIVLGLIAAPALPVWLARRAVDSTIDQYGADNYSWVAHAISHPERALLVVSAGLHLVALVFGSKSSEARPRRRSLLATLLPHAIRLAHIGLVGAVWYVWIHNAAIPPYATPDGDLFVHRSVRGRTGQVVVADNRRDGYRFLRVDNSLVGGRWFEYEKNAQGSYTPRLGDSIFAAFFVQEFGWFAQRSTVEDAARGVELVTGVNLTASVAELDPRALIIGLGVGVAAESSRKRGIATDYVEYDAEVAAAARDFFGMYAEDSMPPHGSVIDDGAEFVRLSAGDARSGAGSRWSVVVQDCFSAGELPVELFTREFWHDIQDVLQPGGVVVTNVVGLPGSRTMRAVAVTLASSFAQCRIFTDENGGHDPEQKDKILNTVFICSNVHDPILSFRTPTKADALGSPSRQRVYSSLLRSNEVQIEEIVQEQDWSDESMILRRGQAIPAYWQKDLAISAWYSMRKILTPEMWMAW